MMLLLKRFVYYSTLLLLWPFSFLLVFLFRSRVKTNSVLHISYLIHVPYHTVQLLRDNGVNADYLAIGDSPYWQKADFIFVPKSLFVRAFQEFIFFWSVVSRYQIIHSHFMIMLSRSGWEIWFFKKLGRKIVVHYRGCEIRDWQLNMKLHPQVNICQDCDYNRSICTDKLTLKRREAVKKYGDIFLVTTPDLLDFVDNAVHLPFFSPASQKQTPQRGFYTPPLVAKSGLKIVHATNHPGIEGTKEIVRVIEALQHKGFGIEFECLQGKKHSEILAALAQADLSIGKMKMGYYANFQVESLALGVPCVTYIRPDILNFDVNQTGIISTSLDDLSTTLEYYLKNPMELKRKKDLALKTIDMLHDNKKTIAQLVSLYNSFSSESFIF